MIQIIDEEESPPSRGLFDRCYAADRTDIFSDILHRMDRKKWVKTSRHCYLDGEHELE
jgi:hypothetical protein